MVMLATRLILLTAIASSLVALPDGNPANCRVGEPLAGDIVTPVPLMVVDREATEALRQQALPRLAVVFRFYPRWADESVAACLTTIAESRQTFVDAVEKTFATRQLDATAVASTQFQRFVADIQKDNPNLPGDGRLLAAWARGESDDAILGPAVGRLREAMSRYIRPEGLPSSIKPGSRARVVTVTSAGPLTLETVEQRYDDVARTDLPTLSRARADLLAAFPAEDQLSANFVAGFLKENCQPDAELTRQYRARKTEALLSADHYTPGQLIARRGQIVTVKIKAALDELNEQLKIRRLEQQVADSRLQTRLFGERSLWLLAGLLAVVLVSGFAIWRIAALRRVMPARPQSQVPMKVLVTENNNMVICCPTCAENIVVPIDTPEETAFAGHEHLSHEHWKQRALVAERRTAQAAALVRAGLLSQVSHFLTDDLVKKLVGQRDLLLETHQQAATEVEALEKRLGRTEGDWRKQRAAYEQRIAGLEQDLANANEMNRELIQAKITLAREQMAVAEATHTAAPWS